MPLPHRFPFRLIDRTADRVRVLASSNAHWLRDGGELDLPLLVEAAAQAAAELLAPESTAGSGAAARASAEKRDELLLAGLSECTMSRRARPGETLEFEVALRARMGAVVQVGAVVRSAGDEVARLTLTLTRSSGA